jgi:hypothetical protein
MATTPLVHPAPGGPAPDFDYKTIGGEPRRLSSLWAEGPALVVWLRHFG